MSFDDYAYFKPWNELLTFRVNGVQIRALAGHSYREETIRIVFPFVVEGSDHNIGFRPPLIVLGPAVAARNRMLEEQGRTIQQESLRMAKNLYLLHSTKLRIQPEIEKATRNFLQVFQPEIDELNLQSMAATQEYRKARDSLKIQQMNSGKVDLNENSKLALTRKYAQIFQNSFKKLKSGVEYELFLIEKNLIRAALHSPLEVESPLKVIGI